MKQDPCPKGMTMCVDCGLTCKQRSLYFCKNDNPCKHKTDIYCRVGKDVICNYKKEVTD